MRKKLSLLLAGIMILAAGVNVTATDNTESFVSYTYDFNDAKNDPEITWLNTPTKSKVEFTKNPVTGSRAMKFTGSNEDWAIFSIDLPAAITTRYALVKMKATPTVKETSMQMSNGPAFLSGDEKTSVRFAYFSNYPVIYYKNAEGNTQDSSVNSQVSDSTVAAGRTDIYEALLDFKEKTVSLLHNQTNELKGYFIDKDANGIKTLKFETTEKTNQVIYYDDIEIIGFNDMSAITPTSVTPSNGATDVSGVISSISLEYPMRMYSTVAESMDFEVIKNGNTLEKNKDYTVNAGGESVSIYLTSEAGVNTEIIVMLNGKRITGFTTGNKKTIEYKYDFNDEANDPKITWLNTPTKSKIEFIKNPVTGSRAMKFTGSNEDRASFSIDLPAAVTTRYALVKMKATPTVKDTSINITGPVFLSGDEKTSMRFAYFSNYPVIYYKNAEGNTQDSSVNSQVSDSTVAAGRTDIYEALLDFKEKTVSLLHNQTDEVNGYFIDNDATGIKTLKFETTEKINQEIYYDDIEIIGFNSLTMHEPLSITPKSGEKDVHVKAAVELQYGENLLYSSNLDEFKSIIEVAKNGDTISKDEYFFQAKNRSTMQIMFENEMEYGTTYEVFYQNKLLTSFTTKEKNFNRSDVYDFDVNTPEISNITSESGADIQILTDKTTSSNALRVRVPIRSKLSFDMDIGGTTADYAILTMKMRLESSRDDSEIWKGPYQNTNAGAPSVRDTMGNEIAMMYCYLRPNIKTADTQRGANHWREQDSNLYADYRLIMDFKSKTAIADITDAFGNWGNTAEGKFINTNAGDLSTLHFEFDDSSFSGSDLSNLILWIDDICINEYDDLALLEIQPENKAENVGINQPVRLKFNNWATLGMLDRIGFSLMLDGKELKNTEDYKLKYDGNYMYLIPINGWEWGKTYTISAFQEIRQFKVTDWKNEKTTVYDFDSNIPEILRHNMSEGASAEVLADETTKNKALKIIRPANGRANFLIPLPVTSANTVKVSYKMRLEKLHKNDMPNGFYERVVAEANKGIPAIRDTEGNQIVYVNAGSRANVGFHNGSTSAPSALEWRSENEPYYCVEHIIDFKKKTTASSVNDDERKIENMVLEIRNGVNVADLYFDYVGSDYDMIMYIDDIVLTEIAGEAFRIDGVTVKSADGIKITSNISESAGQTVSVTADIINELIGEEKGILIAQILNKDNMICDIDYTDVSVDDDVRQYTLQLDLPADLNEKNTEKYDIKLMLWSKFGGYRVCEPVYLIGK